MCAYADHAHRLNERDEEAFVNIYIRILILKRDLHLNIECIDNKENIYIESKGGKNK
jgi:hypothetical protein